MHIRTQIKQKKYFLIILFIFSFILRACFFILFEHDNKCMLMFDSGHYHKLAVTIAQTNTITNPDGSPQFYRLPGYPIYLALCYKLFGENTHIALWIQIALASLIPILIFALTLILFPESIILAQCTALAASINPGFLIFSGLVMTEILFLFFFILFLCLFFRNFKFFFEKQKKHNTQYALSTLFVAGLFLGIASLIRPVGHFILILAIIFLLFSINTYYKKIAHILTLSAGWLSIAGIWLIHNYILTGYFFLHTLTGVHFLNHSATRLAMHNKQISYQEAKKQINDEFSQAQKQKNQELNRPLYEIEINLIAEKIAYKYMQENFITTSEHFSQNILKTIFSLYSSELLVIDSEGQLPDYQNQRSLKNLLTKFLKPNTKNKNIIFFIYFELLFFLLLLLGFFRFLLNSFLQRQNIIIMTKIIPLIAIFVILSCACGFARLRLPFEPFLIIVSCKFWTQVFSLSPKKGEEEI